MPSPPPAVTSTTLTATGASASAGTAPVAATAAAPCSTPTRKAARSPLAPSAAPGGEDPLLWAEALEAAATRFLTFGWDAEAADMLGAAGGLRERVEGPA